jgi:hypothetical protein
MYVGGILDEVKLSKEGKPSSMGIQYPLLSSFFLQIHCHPFYLPTIDPLSGTQR